MPEPTAEDWARMRARVQLRNRCVRATLEHYERVGLKPVDTYARAAFDAMETLIREDERSKISGEGERSG